jgi:hypothetical protein
MSEETRNPDANVFLRAECIAAIKAAVAEERARCAGLSAVGRAIWLR